MSLSHGCDGKGADESYWCFCIRHVTSCFHELYIECIEQGTQERMSYCVVLTQGYNKRGVAGGIEMLACV